MNMYNFTVITQAGARIPYKGIPGVSLEEARNKAKAMATSKGHVVTAVSIGIRV